MRDTGDILRELLWHLPGDPGDPSWRSPLCWKEYQSRLGLGNRLDQVGHRWMVLWTSEREWRWREADQWPSKTGIFDTAHDTIVFWRAKAGVCLWPPRRRAYRAKADALLAAIRQERPHFMRAA